MNGQNQSKMLDKFGEQNWVRNLFL